MSTGRRRAPESELPGIPGSGRPAAAGPVGDWFGVPTPGAEAPRGTRRRTEGGFDAPQQAADGPRPPGGATPPAGPRLDHPALSAFDVYRPGGGPVAPPQPGGPGRTAYAPTAQAPAYPGSGGVAYAPTAQAPAYPGQSGAAAAPHGYSDHGTQGFRPAPNGLDRPASATAPGPGSGSALPARIDRPAATEAPRLPAPGTIPASRERGGHRGAPAPMPADPAAHGGGTGGTTAGFGFGPHGRPAAGGPSSPHGPANGAPADRRRGSAPVRSEVSLYADLADPPTQVRGMRPDLTDPPTQIRGTRSNPARSEPRGPRSDVAPRPEFRPESRPESRPAAQPPRRPVGRAASCASTGTFDRFDFLGASNATTRVMPPAPAGHALELPDEPGPRHRGHRRSAFRAAIPIAAVLAASGGALALINVVDGGSRAQGLDVASGPNAAISTTLSDPGSSDADGVSLTTGSEPNATGALTHATDGTQPPGTTPVVAQTGANGDLGTTTLPGGGVTSTGHAAPSTATPTSAPGTTPTTPQPSGPTSTTPPTTPPSSSPSGSDPSPPPSSDPSSDPTSDPTSDPSSDESAPGPTDSSTTPPVTPSGSVVSSSAVPGSSTLRLGDSGAAVSDLQTRLDRLLGASGWIPVTGNYDNRTAAAVAQAQQMLGVTADPVGVYGPATRAALEANT